jgi:hypothetical protein
MPHGIDAYFDELSLHRRRVALCGVVVLVAAVLAELAAQRPTAVTALNEPRRWGYEGEDNYVRRIVLETEGPVDQPGTRAQNVVPVTLRAGGNSGETGPHAKLSGTTPTPLHGGAGPARTR